MEKWKSVVANKPSRKLDINGVYLILEELRFMKRKHDEITSFYEGRIRSTTQILAEEMTGLKPGAIVKIKGRQYRLMNWSDVIWEGAMLSRFAEGLGKDMPEGAMDSFAVYGYFQRHSKMRNKPAKRTTQHARDSEAYSEKFDARFIQEIIQAKP